MVRRGLFRFRVEFPDLALIEEQNVTLPSPILFWDWVDRCCLSLSTQVLALNWAGRCKEKWGKEKAEKRIPQSSKYVAAQGEKLFCLSTWALSDAGGVWGAPRPPAVVQGQESPKYKIFYRNELEDQDWHWHLEQELQTQRPWGARQAVSEIEM